MKRGSSTRLTGARSSRSALIVYIVLGLITLVFALLLGWLGAIIGALASIVGTFWLQGALVEAVQDVRDGKQDLSIGEMSSACSRGFRP